MPSGGSRSSAAPQARFRARIVLQGVNPCLEVPARVTRQFAAHARAGRIAVERRLGRTPFLATLVPVAGGRHRLFVNGGLRAAAGVGVGGEVRVTLQPLTDPAAVPLPPGVAAGLRRAGAREAFEALPTARRRELLRYVADARTPEARARRVEKVAAHVQGRAVARAEPATARRPAAERPLWTCPRCGNAFVTRNQWHSCRSGRLEDVFAGRPEHVLRLFERLRDLIESFGPVRIVPYRDRVGFMVQVRFAGAAPRRDGLDVGFWLPRRLDHPRFRKVETLGPAAHVHQLRVRRPEELDPTLRGWLREAYAVGRREHLRPPQA